MDRETGLSSKLQRLTVPVYLLKIRGELAIGAHLRAAHLYSVDPRRIGTMMQSCASAAKLRAAGPFSRSASVPCSNTVSRHLGSSTRQSGEKPARAPSR
jgi:hypothetical protein